MSGLGIIKINKYMKFLELLNNKDSKGTRKKGWDLMFLSMYSFPGHPLKAERSWGISCTQAFTTHSSLDPLQ